MILERTTEDLPVKLTPDEVRERGEELASLHSRLEEHKAHEDQVKRDLKSARARIEDDIDRMASIIRAKQEPRPIEVELVADFEQGVARYIRQDTFKIFRERALTPGEKAKRQASLPLE